MKRNRESKYRQKLINCLHKNKSQQKDLDTIIQKYGVTYYDMYKFAVRHNYLYSKNMVFKIIGREMDEVFKSFGDMSELPLDLFEPINNFRTDERPYYLGFDFAKGSDLTEKIKFNRRRINYETIREI